jgi:hypothetical protein
MSNQLKFFETVIHNITMSLKPEENACQMPGKEKVSGEPITT